MEKGPKKGWVRRIQKKKGAVRERWKKTAEQKAKEEDIQ